MTNVSSTIGKELYKIEIKSPSGNMVIADEPIDKGGKNLGFSPKELLVSALAARTSATVRMYADRKGCLRNSIFRSSSSRMVTFQLLIENWN